MANRTAILITLAALLAACAKNAQVRAGCIEGCHYTCGGGVRPPFFNATVKGGTARVGYAGRELTLPYSHRDADADIYRANGWTLTLVADRASLDGPGAALHRCGGTSIEG